jgi:hypothetical protein
MLTRRGFTLTVAYAATRRIWSIWTIADRSDARSPVSRSDKREPRSDLRQKGCFITAGWCACPGSLPLRRRKGLAGSVLSCLPGCGSQSQETMRQWQPITGDNASVAANHKRRCVSGSQSQETMRQWQPITGDDASVAANHSRRGDDASMAANLRRQYVMSGSQS